MVSSKMLLDDGGTPSAGPSNWFHNATHGYAPPMPTAPTPSHWFRDAVSFGRPDNPTPVKPKSASAPKSAPTSTSTATPVAASAPAPQFTAEELAQRRALWETQQRIKAQQQDPAIQQLIATQQKMRAQDNDPAIIALRATQARMRAQQEQDAIDKANAAKDASAQAAEDAKRKGIIDANTVTIPDATADANYIQTTGDLARQLARFKSAQQLANSQYDSGYDDSLHKLGWDPTKKAFDASNRNGAYGASYYDNENDFASRGLADSGMRLQALSGLNNQFNQQKSTLDRGAQDFDANQGQALQEYSDQNSGAKKQALADAIARISAQFGVGTDVVQSASGKGGTRYQKPINWADYGLTG